MQEKLKSMLQYINRNRFNPKLMRHFDGWLYAIVLALSFYGVLAIYAATATAIRSDPENLLEILNTHPITYARLQLIWMVVGTVAMFAMIYFSYELFGSLADIIYWGNVFLLLAVLTVEAGRGGMTAFFTWSGTGQGGERGFQPSEFGKIAMIIALAKLFAERKQPISTLRELVPVTVYVMIPLVLVILQPDFGTALVYIAIFALLLFVSGTSWKLIVGVLCVAVVVLVPLWYYMNASSNSFRLTRILMWLDPEAYPDDARQIINGQIAIGSGGLTGSGLVSAGSFASLGYIPDDHTDFCFAIVCEAFGFVGACVLLLLFALLIARLIYHTLHIEDRFGAYIITGVTAMFLFHIVENVGMIIGLLPVTGIPLPFISYGGSNYLTNMLAIGLVLNVVMRSRFHRNRAHRTVTRRL